MYKEGGLGQNPRKQTKKQQRENYYRSRESVVWKTTFISEKIIAYRDFQDNAL